MRVTVDSKALDGALRHRLSDARSTLPTLHHVLLKAADGELAITSTDLGAWLTVRVPAQIEEAGSVLAHGDKLAAATLGGGEIKLGIGEVRRGRSKLRVPCDEDVAAFPSQDETAFEPLALG